MFGETQIFFLGGNQPMQVEKPGKIPRGGGGGGGMTSTPWNGKSRGWGPKGMNIFWKYTIIYLISDSYLQK